MANVGILDSNTSKFTKNSELDLHDLAVLPVAEMLKKEPILKKEIDGVIFSSCSNEQYSSSIISEKLGLTPKISHNMDNLCNSGTNAIVTAYSYISSGLCDCILIVGAEKKNTAGKVLDWDISRGAYSSPIFWASIFAKLHMKKYGTSEEQLAKVTVKNRKNALNNKNALFNEPVTLDDVLNSKKIAEPIKILDSSVICEGSSCLLLASEKKIKQMKFQNDKPDIWIKGIGQQTNCASFSGIIDDIFSNNPAKIAARQAYNMAKIKPSMIDIAEVHDAFSILEIMAYEDLGFANRGNGGKFIDDYNNNTDNITINARGGILGCGHPLGATGIDQVSAVFQLMRENTKIKNKQIRRKKFEYGLVHNLAAAGTSATILIFKKE